MAPPGPFCYRSPVMAIRLLPPDIVNRIAAGEVIERPASAVKELVENAIDAGARRIDVTLKDGGRNLIQVVDDGLGMTPQELTLAVERHATSKLPSDDLTHIATLGFRGEALPSIGAVGRLTITSRKQGAEEAWRLAVEAGAKSRPEPAALGAGTRVDLADLFFATPARLRFLRSSRTETGAAVRAVADLALARPEVAFHVSADGRTALRTPGGTLHDAARSVLGSAAAAALIGVDAPGDMAISGLISQAGAHRAARDQLLLVVNGRPIHNRMLGVAVEEAYRGLLPAGRHPYGVVMLTVAPESVDVNVHPAKREVRFRDERRVFAAVQRACWAALQGGAAAVAAAWQPVGEGRGGLRLLDAALRGPSLLGEALAAAVDGEPRATASASLAKGPEAPPPGLAGVEPVGGVAALGPLRALGQAGSRWLIAESPRGIVLVDPHAAHEKVLYAELLAGWARADAGGEAIASQLLLLPVVVECDPATGVRLDEHLAAARRLGFELEAFGPGLVRCAAVPAACAGADVARLVTDVLGELTDDAQAQPPAERRHRLGAALACHSAVRFGDTLDLLEQARLLQRLATTEGGTTCPHGRPTVLLLDDAALRGAFRRPAE